MYGVCRVLVAVRQWHFSSAWMHDETVDQSDAGSMLSLQLVCISGLGRELKSSCIQEGCIALF